MRPTYDPGGSFIVSEAWVFGDGASATGCCPFHRYAAVGNYTVHLTVTTQDGRTASTSQVVQVANHDVSITRLSVPKSARQNQTGKISVSLASKLAAETVHIDLYKSDPSYYDGFRLIGSQELLVPARSSNRTVTVNFNYTFTSDDASIGKVTFKAVATIIGARDVLPGDNEARATTKVSR